MKPIINIKLGDKPVAQSVIERAKKAHMVARGWTDVMRDDAMVEPTLKAAGWITETPAFNKAMGDLARFENALLLTAQINSFNAQLAAYRTAQSRLSHYVLADGRAEVWQDQPTGEIDPETFEPITESVLVQTAVDPLPETIEQPVLDAETGEQTGVEDIPNPAIVKDKAERLAAQAVVDATPQEVKDWVNQ